MNLSTSSKAVQARLIRAEDACGDIFANPFATFTEWESEEDRKAYDEP